MTNDLTRYRGAFTALVTPMTGDGAIDFPTLEQFYDWQVNEGIHGVIPMGTTGESPVLKHTEHRAVIERCVDVVAGRVPVMAGTGSNNTAAAIGLSEHAEHAGADALLVVTPYYNKPSRDGLRAHFLAIDAAVSIPIFLYDIPGRSVVEIGSDLVAELITESKNIVGIKDATGNLVRPMELHMALKGKAVQFSGEDPSELAFLAQGGHGIISVTANIAPKLHAEIHEAWWAGDFARAAKIRDQLFPLAKACFHGDASSPAPTKYGLSRLNLMSDFVRLPGVSTRQTTRKAVDAAMRHAGLI
ncbi:MAG: 4-hydroxy-tetrahydrodipicolinate synthase [Alphaproteobacteria bacterium]|nr:4-hydroxy-tetrahydrodipicolinate synthase [Alphaproteobacteria bacterium]